MDAWWTAAFLWDGVVLHVGDSAPSAGHTHALMQVALGLEGPVSVKTASGEWTDGECVVVAPNAWHAFRARRFALLWIEPESEAARRLEAAHTRHAPIAVIPGVDLEPIRSRARELLESRTCQTAWQLCSDVIRSLTGDLPPPSAVHPAIRKALRIIEDQQQFKISARSLAAAVGLSEGRFAHAFRQTTGVPLRRFLMWKRTRSAVLLLVNGKTATEAAIEAGFTDGAHLNRTLMLILGVHPSDLRSANIELRLCDGLAPVQ